MNTTARRNGTAGFSQNLSTDVLFGFPRSHSKKVLPVKNSQDKNEGLSTSNRNPLDDVSRYPSSSAIVEAGCSGVGVAGEVLDVGEGDALAEEIRDGRDSERMSG